MKKALLASVFSISLHAATIDQVLVESLIDQANTQKSDALLYEVTPDKATRLINLFESINSSSKEMFEGIPEAIKQEYAVSAPLVLHGLLQAISEGKGEKTSDVKLLILDAIFRDKKTLEQKAHLHVKGSIRKIIEAGLCMVSDQPHGEIVTKKTLQGIHPQTELRYLNDCPENLDDFFLVNFSITLPFLLKGYRGVVQKLSEKSFLKIVSTGNFQNSFLQNSASFPDLLEYISRLSPVFFRRFLLITDLTPQGLLHRGTYPGHSRFKDRTLAAFNHSKYSETRIIDGGSSYASPMVSNAALLLKATYPTFNAETIADILLASALRTFSISFPKTNIVLDIVENGKEHMSIDSQGMLHLELPFETVSGLYGRGILNFQNADYFAQAILEQNLSLEDLESKRDLLPVRRFENRNHTAVEPGSKWEDISLLLFLRKLRENGFIQEHVLPFLQEHTPDLSAKKKIKQSQLRELDRALSKVNSQEEFLNLVRDFSLWLKDHPREANHFILSTDNSGLSISDIKESATLESFLGSPLPETKEEKQALYLISKIRARVISQKIRDEIELSLWKSSVSDVHSMLATLSLFLKMRNNEHERFFNSNFIKGFIDPIVDLLETNRDSLGEISNLFVDYMRDPDFSLSEKLLNKLTQDRFPTYALLSLLMDFIKVYKLEPLFETTQKLSSSGRLLSRALAIETPKKREALLFKEFELVSPSEISQFMEDIVKDCKLLFGKDESEVGTEIKFYLAGLNQAFSELKTTLTKHKGQ